MAQEGPFLAELFHVSSCINLSTDVCMAQEGPFLAELFHGSSCINLSTDGHAKRDEGGVGGPSVR